MRETVLDSSSLRECCGRKPVFRRYHFKAKECYEIECCVNPYRHCTGLCDSEKMAVWRWQNQKFRR
jgi:hypothetical protein